MGLLLNFAKLVSEVKRLNTRLVAIAKRFGTSSETYKGIVKSLSNGKFSENIRYTKNGVLQLKTSKKSLNSKQGRQALNIARKSFVTQKEMRERLEEQGYKGLTSDEVVNITEENAQTSTDFKRFVDYLYNNYTDEEIQENYDELFKNHDYESMKDFIEENKEEFETIDDEVENLPFS